MGKTEKLYTILVGKPEEKRLLREPKRRCEDNIKMNMWELSHSLQLGP
jgi:hypothetical protein